MVSYVFGRIPLPLPKPRNFITNVVPITHTGDDLGAEGLSRALNAFVAWAEHHEDDKTRHPKLPAEWAERSYLPRPITLGGTNEDVLVQLFACGVKIRVVTTEFGDVEPLYHSRELFSGENKDADFAAWTTKGPALESHLVTLQ